jgi:hypothetical protein
MRKLILVATMLLVVTGVSVYAAKGTVVYTKSGCDYYIVDAPSGYAVLEWYGGAVPSRGDVIAGDFESYGFKNVHNLTKDRDTRVWVEDYWLSKSDAIETLYDQCN